MTADDQGGEYNVNMDDINEMFKNFGFGFNKQDMNDVFGGFGDMFSEGMFSGVQKGRDMSTSLNITFTEAVVGTKKVLVLNKPDTCTTCKGSKMKPGTTKSTCQTCRGSGRVTFQRGHMLIQQTCTACGGIGERISNPCQSCKGTGVGESKTRVEVNVPAGISQSMKLRMSQKGYVGQNGGPNGDL